MKSDSETIKKVHKLLWESPMKISYMEAVEEALKLLDGKEYDPRRIGKYKDSK